MLNDTDALPVTCANCGNITYEKIGWQKKGIRFTCRRCGRTFKFNNEAFVQMLENLKSTVRDYTRTRVFTEKLD